MGRMATPSLYPGERSLPAELRTPSGSNFAQRRLAASLQPSANHHELEPNAVERVDGAGAGRYY